MSETATGAEATGTTAAGNNSFVVVANRLPVDMILEPDGTKSWQESPGGLVSALSPVLEKHQGCWVGWPGVADEAPEPFRTERGVLLHPLELRTMTTKSSTKAFLMPHCGRCTTI